ncbi:ciliary-associated calcium-binding coiled-coil protein 1 [Aquarana catesbeiana]|uniref:ciliary-associated calcium-binding coiled-coil protein 1 n=1 Tax=Aquarana catesbeiana TaxID=8400 RepID=UPI003CCA4810
MCSELLGHYGNTKLNSSSMESLERRGTEQEHNLHDEMEDVKLDFLSQSQINTLLEHEDIDDIQKIMEEFLGFKDIQTNLKEGILVDYYVSGLCWGKENKFSSLQLTGLIGLLHFLMENIETRHLSLDENITELARAMTGIGHSLLKTKGKLSFFSVEQAKDIIDYLKISLFQHYKLYECMCVLPRDQKVIGARVEVEIAKPAETPFPAPLEEGIPYEMYTQFLAPPEPEEENTMAEINDN